MSRVLLGGLTRYRQEPSECSIAAAACLANYFDRSVSYSHVRAMVTPRSRKSGLYSSQQARLLNSLGFGRVTIITADLSLVDFSWQGLKKETIIHKLSELATHYGRSRDRNSKLFVLDMVKWLKDDRYNNRLVIDNDFAKYIRKSLDHGYPVGIAVDWTSLFHYSKTHPKTGSNDDIRGESVEHAIVLRGYDRKGVYVVDSHHQSYRGRLKKYHNGHYKISWEQLLVNIPDGDVILVS